MLASAELGEADEAKRPSVQIGDPFAEKKLMECSLELLERGLLVALQDLGAAGLTSAASEMASKGGVGIDIDVARVPLREPGMAPFEIMVSESQERMLCVVEPDALEAVLAVCAHWETAAATIGEVTDSGLVRVLDGGRRGRRDAGRGARRRVPALRRSTPAARASRSTRRRARMLASEDPGEALLALLRSPNIADRPPLFEQYDCVVQSRTVRRPGQPTPPCCAARRATARAGIAVAIDGNGRRVAADPYRGTVEAVLECAANLACVGAEPLGLTNCLNFGNPEKPHIAWQLDGVVRGPATLARARDPRRRRQRLALQRGRRGPDLPDPGDRDGRRAARRGTRRAARLSRGGRPHRAVGLFAPDIRGSELARLGGAGAAERRSRVRRRRVCATQRAVRDAVRAGALASAHDIADGGLATALAECCLAGGARRRGRARRHGQAAARTVRRGPGGFVVSGGDRSCASCRTHRAEIVGSVAAAS